MNHVSVSEKDFANDVMSKINIGLYSKKFEYTAWIIKI